MDLVIFISDVVRGDNMAKRKIDPQHYEDFVRDVANALTLIGGDLIKLQKLVYASLDASGNIETVTCPSCNEQLMIPINLPNIEKNDKCPNCGGNVYSGEQKTFENWDEGIAGEEE